MFCSNSVIRAAVEELCHYHPMGVYYYVGKRTLVNMNVKEKKKRKSPYTIVIHS